MKTKKIWYWAMIFGLLATGTLYIALFYNDKGQTVNEASMNTANQNENTPQSGNNNQAEETGNEVNDSTNKAKEVNDGSDKEGEVEEPVNEFLKQELLPIASGKRAISINVDKSQGVQGYISAGDFIDVIALTPSKEEWNHDDEAQLMLQNIKVLGLGHTTDTQEMSANYEAVTLEVTPEEGLRLSLALEGGKVYLMLRGKDDKDKEQEFSHIHADQLHIGGHLLIGGHR